MRTILDLLKSKIGKVEIDVIVNWVLEKNENKDSLYELSLDADDTISANSIWCLTHLPKELYPWLQSKQNELIDRLLKENKTSKKRMLFQLLRNQKFCRDSLRIDFIDFCFSKINSESEPYAIRCFSIYCAFNMCCFYPELIAELEQYLNLLSLQNLSPGLKSALQTTRNKISKLFYS